MSHRVLHIFQLINLEIFLKWCSIEYFKFACCPYVDENVLTYNHLNFTLCFSLACVSQYSW